MLARITTALLASSLFVSVAHAASPLPSGTQFVVRDVSTSDAYYSTRAGLIGLSCTAGAEGLTDNAGYWGGPAVCSDGASYYFYQAVIDVLAGPGNVKSLGTVAATAESATVGSMPKGSRFVVREVSSSDAYYGSDLSGLRCVAGDGMTRSDGQWWSGPAVCDGGDRYFFQASFDLDRSAVGVTTAIPPVAPMVVGTALGTLPAGTQFVVASIHPEDAYYSTRASMEGLSCTATDALSISVEGTPEYGGPAICTDGSSYYFYRAAVRVTGTDSSYTSGGGGGIGMIGAAGDRFTGPWLPKKTQVVIADISSNDAFFALRDSLNGQICTVSAKSGLVASGTSGDGWMGGSMKCSGVKLEFYQVAVQTIGY